MRKGTPGSKRYRRVNKKRGVKYQGEGQRNQMILCRTHGVLFEYCCGSRKRK